MEIDTHLLSDEQINKLNETVAEMLKQNLYKKWWIRPTHGIWENTYDGRPKYIVEPQEDFYGRDRPPLKSDFATKEEAQKWLDDYLAEEDKFLKAIDEINNLNCNLGHILEKFNRHERVTKDDWDKCFELFNASMSHGTLKEITEGE